MLVFNSSIQASSSITEPVQVPHFKNPIKDSCNSIPYGNSYFQPSPQPVHLTPYLENVSGGQFGGQLEEICTELMHSITLQYLVCHQLLTTDNFNTGNARYLLHKSKPIHEEIEAQRIIHQPTPTILRTLWIDKTNVNRMCHWTWQLTHTNRWTWLGKGRIFHYIC